MATKAQKAAESIQTAKKRIREALRKKRARTKSTGTTIATFVTVAGVPGKVQVLTTPAGEIVASIETFVPLDTALKFIELL